MLAARFAQLKERGEGALVTFVTAGDPPIAELPNILKTLEESGADVIEVGIPFSDPIADGPVIQASSQRALDRGTTPVDVLSALAESKVGVPLVLMGYYNPIRAWGLKGFATRCKEVGVSGVIVSDLIPEEAGEWIEVCRAEGIDTIFLAAPTSTDERLASICEVSSGFVYAVSRTGVTGALDELPPEGTELVARCKRLTETPVCIGFGISNRDAVRVACRTADGVVVGSALVAKLAECWSETFNLAEVAEFISGLKSGTH